MPIFWATEENCWFPGLHIETVSLDTLSPQADAVHSLNFSNCLVTDDELSVLERFPSLMRVQFDNCDRLEGPGLQYLSGSSATLKWVTLRDCARLSDNSLGYLEAVPQIDTLKLVNLRIGKDLRYWSIGLPNLVLLEVTRCSEFTDHSLAALEQFPVLKWLRLQGVPITDEGLRYLVEMRRTLRTLEVPFGSSKTCRITKDGRDALKRRFRSLRIRTTM